MFRELRESRTIFGAIGPSYIDAEATIFLGLFNAVPYLDSLKEQIKSQSLSLPIVIVDNNSTDETWDEIQSWLSLFPGQLALVRNPINLGASGSLYVNADLIETPWFITMHQDDFYKPNHAQTLVEAISKSEADTICITTEMGSMAPGGECQPCPPRASWLLPDFEPATIFTSNIKVHNVPYPAAAFRSKVFFENAVPWETTSFPDTEWVLSVASLGKFKFVEKETMLYRENPLSESHSIDSEEKSFGASLALLRVFGSKSFDNLCLSTRPEERHRFAASVLDGLKFRLGDSPHKDLVCTFASQKMAAAWGYSDLGTNTELIRSFNEIGAKFPVELLSSLNSFLGSPRTSQNPKTPQAWQNRSLKKRFPRVVKLVLAGYGLLPSWARRVGAKIFGAIIRYLNIKSTWNFRWK